MQSKSVTKIQMLIIAVFSVIVICSLALYIYSVINRGPADDMGLVREAIGSSEWEVISGSFDSSSKQPLVLNRSAESVLYIQDGTMRFAENQQQATELYRWGTDGNAQVWKWDEGLIIGWRDLTDTPGESGKRTEWLFVSFSTNGDQPAVIALDRIRRDPEDLIHVRYSTTQPNLVWLAFRNPMNGGYIDFWFDADNQQSGSVHAMPYEDVQEPDLQQTSKVRLWEGTQWNDALYTFEDERGTILYRMRAQGPEVNRLRMLELKDVISIPNESLNQDQWYAHLARMGEEEEFLFPIIGISRLLPYNPVLTESGWNVWDETNFYRITADQIETVGYEYRVNRPFMNLTTFPIADVQLVERDGELLAFERSGETQYLNLYDLFYVHKETTSLEDLWIRSLPEQLAERRDETPQPEQGTEGAAKTVILPQERVPLNRQAEHWPEAIQHVLRTAGEFENVDGRPNHTYVRSPGLYF